jgi:hypothetical protein
LEIRFTRSGQPDTTIRFDVSANTCQYLVSNAGTVSSLAQFDPNNWVINKSGTKVYDPNFFLTINENDMASGFKLYPNPVEDDLNIVAIDKNTAYQVYITDANGKRITSGLFKDQLTLSTSTLDHGKYVLSLFKENQLVEAIPFIKQ